MPPRDRLPITFILACLVGNLCTSAVGDTGTLLNETTLTAGHPTSTCNPTSQRTSLLLLYARTGGPNWVNSSMWPTGPVRETMLQAATTGACSTAAGLQLPDHCCFHGVECCDRETCPVMSPYVDTSCDCTVGMVTGIQTKHNNLTGPLFTWQGGNFTGVQMLDALACSLRKLDLRHNQLTGQLPNALTLLTELRILDLAYNNISGSFPPNMQVLLALRLLDMALNNMNGTVPRDLCSESLDNALSELTLAGNHLTGELDIFACNNLIMLNVNDCDFTRIASRDPLVVLPNLHLVFFSGNSLHSTLFHQMAEMAPVVDTLIFKSNRLTGSLPASLAMMPSLSTLVLADNRLSGELDEAIFYQMDSLSHLDLSGNRFRGPLPETLGSGQQLQYLDLSGNLLTGSLPNSFSDMDFHDMYLDLTGTAMSCCGVDFMLHSMEPRNWSYAYYNFSLPRLPPGLNFSKNCWTATATALCCPFVQSANDAENSSLNWYLDPEYSLFESCKCPEGLEMVTSQSVMGRYSAWCSSPDRGDTAWFKQWFWIWIVVGLVLTVVLVGLHWWIVIASGSRPMLLQSFVDMRKRLKGGPKSGIVSVVVTDIEGFTSLVKQHPDAMMQALQLHNQVMRVAMWTNFGTTVEQEGDSYSIVFHEALDAVKFCLQAQQLLEKQLWPPDLVSGNSLGKKRGKTGKGSAFFNELASRWHRSSLGLGQRRSKTASPTAHSPSPSNGSFRVNHSPNPSASRAAKSGLSYCHALEMEPLHPVNGLRVRMGVSTGHVAEGLGVVGSQVMEMAKVVSDAASGGQTFMCGATFSAVQSLGKELGCVGPQGTTRNIFFGFNYWSPFKPRQHQQQEDAMMLDMGDYLCCGADAELPLLLTPRFLEEVGSVSQEQMAAAQREKQDTALRIYQVLAPSLVARGRFFGPKLALKHEWKQLERDFFSAPGALAAQASNRGGAEQLQLGAPAHAALLPKVTMVFCTIEGGRQYAQRSRSKDMREVYLELLAVIRSVLLQVPGGYLLRHHVGETKFMVAFDNPKAALVWCMAVSECAMYAAWPPSALRAWPEEMCQHGQLLFRGPRLKMGVCEGRPGSILPDYLGKADYLGDSINQAARFMDAAAHGGQVVCEQALVETLLAPPPPHLHTMPSAFTTTSFAADNKAGDARPWASDASGSALPEDCTSSARQQQQPMFHGLGLSPCPGLGPGGTHRLGCPSREHQFGPSQLLPTLEENRDHGGAGGKPHGPGAAAEGAAAHTSPDSTPPSSMGTTADACHASPDVPHAIEVVAMHLGLFSFKGVAGLTPMVHVCHKSLAARRFPDEAPSGKGQRVQRKAGVLVTASLPLLRVVEAYREGFSERAAASRNARSTTSFARAAQSSRLASILSMVRLGTAAGADREPGPGPGLGSPSSASSRRLTWASRWRKSGNSMSMGARDTEALAFSAQQRSAAPPGLATRSVQPGAAPLAASTSLRELVVINVSELQASGQDKTGPSTAAAVQHEVPGPSGAGLVQSGEAGA